MNKSLAFLLLSLSLYRPAFAQSGAHYLGGDVGFMSISGSNSDTAHSAEANSFSWSVAPEAGVYLTDRVQVGASISIGGSKRDVVSYGSAYSERYISYGGGAYVRCFLTTGVLRPFLGLNVRASVGRAKQDGQEVHSKGFGISSGLNAGFAYNLSPRFAAFASLAALNFSHTESRAQDGSGGKEVQNVFSLFGSSNASTFNLGVQYLLPKRPVAASNQ